MERLEKFLVSRGAGSRKDVQKLIRGGRVAVNGEACKKTDLKINPPDDRVELDGELICADEYIYIMMNKPSGVVSATRDKRDKTVLDILPDGLKRPGLFPAGRLDKDTTGLLIITNDGRLAHDMLSPKKHVYKQYVAVLDGEPDSETVRRFELGVEFADGKKCLPARLTTCYNGDKNTALVKICEGKFHQVKKMFSACGLKIVQLQRISIGALYLDSNLTIGSCKTMTKLDIEQIFMGNIY